MSNFYSAPIMVPLYRSPVVLATGCFDVLHIGHLKLLEYAKSLGNSLIVAINSDMSVRMLKGPMRPINNEQDRADMLLGLRCVDAVTVFQDDDVVRTLGTLTPCIWVKGSQYTLETLNQDERAAADRLGIKISLAPHIEGYSTTSILKRI